MVSVVKAAVCPNTFPKMDEGGGQADDHHWDDELAADVRTVLEGDNSLRQAAWRLAKLAQPAVEAVSTSVHLPDGVSREMVYRCVAVRMQESYETLLHLVDAGKGHHARLLLRSLCEDHIFIGWLGTLNADTADSYIRTRTALDIADGYEAQRAFLPTAYASLGVKPVPAGAPGLQFESMADFRLRVTKELKSLGKANGWRPYGPSVKDMATADHRSAEYDFFYLASLRSVHANLHEMARMVWGNPESMVVSISTDNLAVLHTDFALAYGTWLFSELATDLARHLRPLRDVVESTGWSVWLAMILVGMARNGCLPPIVWERELAWPAATNEAAD